MTIQLIDPKLIDPNPDQPPTRLHFKPEDIADLASIGDPEIGLRVVPTVRPHPDRAGRYQRCDGHRRQAAWQLYRPGEPMPNDVQDLTDRQMYEFMAIENGQRQDITPIEKALIIKVHIDRFGTTQSVAAALVGIKTQGAVSNLLKLLKLPADVQRLVSPDQVPQRIARLLVRPGQLAPKDTIRLATSIAQASDDDKEDVAENGLRSIANEIGVRISWSDFKVDWDPGEIKIGNSLQKPGTCTACDNYMAIGNQDCCTLRACHAAKRALFPQSELLRVSKELNIPIADKGETVHRLEINYYNENKVKAMLSAKKRPDHLRLIQSERNYHLGEHSRLLGSDSVYLASTDKRALEGKPKLTTAAAEERASELSSETPAQRAKRIEREQHEAELRRAERSIARRARADVTWLIQQLTVATAAQLKIEGGILTVAAEDISHNTFVHSYWEELDQFEKTIHAAKDPAGQKQWIVFRLLLDEIQSYQPAKTFVWSHALKKASAVVEKKLGLKLLTGWDQPPIHRTASNCWACGTFTPGPTITGVDRAAGWTVSGNDGAVACSNECRAKLLASNTKAVKPAAKPAKKAAKR